VGGGFAQLKSSYATWLDIIGAVRYDTFKLSGGTASSSGDRVSPKVTVGVTPVPWFTVYGTYAEGYRAPAITEVFVAGQHPNAGPGSAFIFLPNATLRPEVGKSKEIGVNIRQDNLWMAGDAFRMKANVYRNDIDDFIEQVSVLFGQTGVGGLVCPATDNCIQYQNVTKARIEGEELEGTYDAGKYFLNFGASRSRGRNVITGVPLLKIPPQKVAATLGGRFFDRKLTAAVRWLWVDAKPRSDMPPTTTIPPSGAYNVVNLYWSYQPFEDVLAEFAVDNVFNTLYAPYLNVTTSGTAVLPSFSPGITFKGGLKIFFGEEFFKRGVTG
jgi:hemoglobin/transferrin/lactoferrin receptor protein